MFFRRNWISARRNHIAVSTVENAGSRKLAMIVEELVGVSESDSDMTAKQQGSS